MPAVGQNLLSIVLNVFYHRVILPVPRCRVLGGYWTRHPVVQVLSIVDVPCLMNIYPVGLVRRVALPYQMLSKT